MVVDDDLCDLTMDFVSPLLLTFRNHLCFNPPTNILLGYSMLALEPH
jgi:hypothetical protein